MLKRAKIHNNLTHLNNKHLEPLLIQTGLHDDAIRYFAPAVALNDFGEFLIYISESSMLCDLVKLKRTLVVEVIFGHSCFSAELALAQVPARVSQCALALTLLSPSSESLSNENWVPLT